MPIAAIAAVLVSLAALTISWYQASQARQQNTATEQQNESSAQEELVTLVASITQAVDTDNASQTGSNPSSNARALSAAQSQTEDTELAQSEEALGIVNTLHGRGVTAIEYDEIAVGLEQGEGYAEPLALLKKAQMLPSDPRSHADILRAEAIALYILGRNREAEHAMRLAETLFQGSNIPEDDKEYNTVTTLLFDAYYQVEVNCSMAQSELSEANRMISQSGSAPNAFESSSESSDAQWLATHCKTSSNE